MSKQDRIIQVIIVPPRDYKLDGKIKEHIPTSVMGLTEQGHLYELVEATGEWDHITGSPSY